MQVETNQSSSSYRVGLKSISAPPPADLRETGSDFRVLFEHDVPDSNRLVAAFIPADDIAKLPAKSPNGFERYALLETLRQAEFTDVNETLFKQAKEMVAKQFGTTADAPPLDTKAIGDELNHKLKAEGGTSEVSLEKPVSLGVFFSKSNALGFGLVMDVGVGEKKQKVIVGTTFIRVQNRLLYAAIFSVYTGDNSVIWTRTVSEQWSDAILKANPQ